MAKPLKTKEELKKQTLSELEEEQRKLEEKRKKEEERKRKEEEERKRREAVAKNLAAGADKNPLEKGAEQNLQKIAQQQKEAEARRKQEAVAKNIAANANKKPLERAAEQNVLRTEEKLKEDRERQKLSEVAKNLVSKADRNPLEKAAQENIANLPVPEKEKPEIRPHQQNIPREDPAFRYMTAEEKQKYELYKAITGEESAQKYLDSIREEINRRQAEKIYSGNENEILSQYLLGAQAGLESSKTGFQDAIKMFLEEGQARPTSTSEYLSEMARNDLAEKGPKLPEALGGASLGQVGFDVVNTTANMLPSIMLGTLGGAAVGAAGIGASAAGNAYNSALREGYTQEQARNYGLLVGAAEASLGYLLGGIEATGGKIGKGAMAKLLPKIDNALARAAVNVGGKMGSEFTEEYLQEILDPMFRNLALLEENEIDFLSPEAIYSGILGALSAGGIAVAGGNASAPEVLQKAEVPVPFEGTAQPGTERELVANKITEIENRPISEAEKAAKMEEVAKAAAENGTEPGLAEEAEKIGTFHKERQAEFDEAVAIGKKLGVSVEFDPNIAGNGIHTGDGRIIINPNTENPALQVFVHELTHDIESSGIYQNFSEKILGHIKEQGFDLEGIRQRVKTEYAAEGHNLTDPQIDAEVVAKYCEQHLFTDEKAIQRLLDTDPNLFNRIKYWIEDMIVKFKGTKEERFLLEAQGLYEKALSTRGETAGAGVEQHSYDYSKPFEQQIDDLKNGKIPAYDTLIVGGTPKIFQDVGFNALPMTYGVGHAREVLTGNREGHNFGEAVLKQLPQKIKNPVAIITSQKQNGTSVVALLDVLYQGKQIITPVLVDGYGTQNGIRIDSNPITTMFAKDNAITKLLKEAVIDENNGKVGIYYINKNKAISLLNASGVQFPGGISITDGFNHSIKENSSPVKPKMNNVTESLQFKRWFGDWQKHPQDASKVVNQDGTPKVVYHGTEEDFTVFDRTKGRANMDIQGFFFSPYKEEAADYGGKVGAYYLDIKNPADSTTAYKAFEMFKGQNEAGVKAREYLEKLGYDGVINDDEEFIAFYPEQIKSATDNIGTFDPQNPDVRYSTGSSFDEMAAEAKTASMERADKKLDVENWKGIAESINPEIGMWRMKDFARVLDSAAGGNKVLRQQLHDLYEKPLNEAQGNYARNYAAKAQSITEKFKKLGIKSKSKESAAVQRIGEGVKEIDKHGNTVPYTLDDLKKDFPDSWEKIKEGADYCRKVYDEFLHDLNTMYAEIYPATVEQANARISNYNTRIENDANYIDRYNEVIEALENSKAEKQAELSKKRPNSLVYAEIQNQIANIEHKIEVANERIKRIENRKLAKEISRDTLKAQIENGEILRNKQIKPRKDYFRHFQELTDEFAEIADIFSNDQRIPPNLAGKSETTKPRTIWTSIAQSRKNGNYYTEDAVSGLLKYTEIAEKLLVYDPLISHFRDVNSAIRAAGTMVENEVKGKGTNAGQFASWADRITNQLAGKTNSLDRLIADETGAFGRATIKAVEALNRRVKSNAILGNFRSALVQIGNLPNAALYIQNPADWTMGAISLTNPTEEILDARAKSNFMNRRYMGDSIDELTKEIQDNNILDKPKEFALWMLGAGDKAAAELIWHTAYSRAVRNPGVLNSEKGLRNYENAVDYADDITRRSIGGRAEGDIPYFEESKIIGLVAPFQIEVTNTANALAEQIGKKNVAGIVAFETGVWLINTVLEEITGDRPLGFDYIEAIIDIVKEATGEEEEEDKDIWDMVTFGLGRLAGETISGLPLGAQISRFITGGDEQRAEDWFGDSDPSRYGTGNIGIGAVADAIDYAFIDKIPKKLRELATDGEKNSYAEWSAPVKETIDTFAPLLMPWGGKQFARTAGGIDQIIRGGAFGKDSEGKEYLKFPQENDPESLLKTIIFGQYASDRGQQYIDSGFKDKLSAKQTEQMEIAEPYGISNSEFYDIILGLKPYSKKEEKQKALFENENLDNWEKSVMDYILFSNPTKGMDAVVPEREYNSEEEFYRSGLSDSSKRLFDEEYNKNEIEKIEKALSKSNKKAGDIANIVKALGVSEQEAFEIYQKSTGDWYSSFEKLPEEERKRAEAAADFYGMSTEDYLKVFNYSNFGKTVVDKEGKEKYSSSKKDVVPKIAEVLNITEKRAEELYDRVNSFDYSRDDLEEETAQELEIAAKRYGVEDKAYFIARNIAKTVEGDKDEYDNTVSGSERKKAVKAISSQLGISEEEATIYYLAATGNLILTKNDLTTSQRKDLEAAQKEGWSEREFFDAINIIKVSGASKKMEIIKALTDAGAPYSKAQGFYNLIQDKDYYRQVTFKYGMANKKQESKGDYFLAKYNADGSATAKDIAKWYAAGKGCKKKQQYIDAYMSAGATYYQAEAFYKLIKGHDKGFDAYWKENGGD